MYNQSIQEDKEHIHTLRSELDLLKSDTSSNKSSYSNISNLRHQVDTTILDLEKKMALQHKQYVEIKKAVQDETKKLEYLYQIKITAENLNSFVEINKAKKRELEMEYRRQRDDIKQEIVNKRAQMDKEIKEYESKKRERQIEERSYTQRLIQRHKREQESLKNKKKQVDEELKDKWTLFENEINDRAEKFNKKLEEARLELASEKQTGRHALEEREKMLVQQEQELKTSQDRLNNRVDKFHEENNAKKKTLEDQLNAFGQLVHEKDAELQSKIKENTQILEDDFQLKKKALIDVHESTILTLEEELTLQKEKSNKLTEDYRQQDEQLKHDFDIKTHDYEVEFKTLVVNKKENLIEALQSQEEELKSVNRSIEEAHISYGALVEQNNSKLEQDYQQKETQLENDYQQSKHQYEEAITALIKQKEIIHGDNQRLDAQFRIDFSQKIKTFENQFEKLVYEKKTELARATSYKKEQLDAFYTQQQESVKNELEESQKIQNVNMITTITELKEKKYDELKAELQQRRDDGMRELEEECNTIRVKQKALMISKAKQGKEDIDNELIAYQDQEKKTYDENLKALKETYDQELRKWKEAHEIERVRVDEALNAMKNEQECRAKDIENYYENKQKEIDDELTNFKTDKRREIDQELEREVDKNEEVKKNLKRRIQELELEMSHLRTSSKETMKKIAEESAKNLELNQQRNHHTQVVAPIKAELSGSQEMIKILEMKVREQEEEISDLTMRLFTLNKEEAPSSYQQPIYRIPGDPKHDIVGTPKIVRSSKAMLTR